MGREWLSICKAYRNYPKMVVGRKGWNIAKTCSSNTLTLKLHDLSCIPFLDLPFSGSIPTGKKIIHDTSVPGEYGNI